MLILLFLKKMFNLIVIGITFYINLKNKFEKSGCENRESGV